MKKRLASILLTVCMVLNLLPGATLTASASEPTDYNLRVGGVQVTSENCANITGPGITGSVSYDPSTSKLTLNGANITGFYSINENDAGIYTSRDLTIDLVNANSITPGMSGYPNQNSAGIYVFASNLTISSNSGNGTLSVASNDTTADSTGIYSEWGFYGDSTGNITISGGEITVSGGTSSGAGSRSYGIQAGGNLTISGGEITATGGTAGGSSRGIYVFKILSVTGNATVLAIGGRPGSLYSSFGIQAPNGNSFVSGGAVTATGGDGGSESYGISTNTYTLSITGGIVTAKTNAVPGENKKAVNTSAAIDIRTYAGAKILAGNSESAAKVVDSYSNERYLKFGSMDTYTVTYNGNGGGGSMTAETAAAGVPFPLPACGFTEPSAGLPFHKWAVGSPGGTQVEANGSHTFTADTTVYALWKAATPATTFSFDGADAEKLMGTTTQMQYSLDRGVTWTTCSAETTDLDSVIASITESNDIQIKDLGNGTTTTVSEVQTINITKAATPSAGKADCTTLANNDGKLTGVTAAMEYKLSTSSSWISGTGSDITGLTNGTYNVRVKATGTALASDNQNLTIAAYSAPPSGGGGGSSGGGGVASTLVTKIDTGGTVTGTNVDNLVKEGKSLTVDGKSGETLVFDTEALKTINGQTKDTVKVEIKDVSSDYINEHPGRLVVSLTVTAGDQRITNFGNGTATISLPYDLKEGEKAEDVTVWYLAEDGTMTEVPCTYNPETKLATFQVNHFSLYLVGTADISLWVNPFADVAETSWYYDAVRYVSANGLMNGTADTAFNPNGKTSRGMIVTILWRMENQPSSEKEMTFTDVKSGKYYWDAVAWGSEKGIVSGYSENRFGPEDNITREQLAVILHNYAVSKGIDTESTADLGGFVDSTTIHDWALDAMMWANGEGLINGVGNSKLSPLGSAERCQVAAILQRFILNSAE